jgi:integrase
MSVYKIERKIGHNWRIDFSYKDPVTGANKRHRQTFKNLENREGAKKKERELMAELTTHPADKEAQQSSAGFKDFAAYWLDQKEHEIKPSTYRSYESILRINLVPFFGNQELRTISVKQVQNYKAIRSGKIKPKTINNHLAVLSSALEDAIKWHFTDRNPVLSVKKCQLKTTADDYNYLNAEEAKRFLEVAETLRPRWVPLYGVALNTGLRQGELAALNWQNVDFSKRQIRVNKAVAEDVVGTPKSHKARTVPLNKKAIGYLARQKKQTGSMEYVFISDKGLRINSNRVKTAFKLCRETAGVKVCFHDFRHSFASHMVSRGASLYKVQKALGHKSASTTQRYAHLQQSDLHDAVALLDD